MKKRKYFSWTDELRDELTEFIDALLKTGIRKSTAFQKASTKFGVSASSCTCAYNYKPKKIILNEVNAEELVPRKTPETQSRFLASVEVSNKDIRTSNLSIGIHNDTSNECLLLKVNESVTIIKVKDILITIQNG